MIKVLYWFQIYQITYISSMISKKIFYRYFCNIRKQYWQGHTRNHCLKYFSNNAAAALNGDASLFTTAFFCFASSFAISARA